MKLNLRYFLFLAVFTSLLSCKKDALPLTQANVESGLGSGNWRVTTYMVNGADMSSNFSSFSFQFGTGHVLSITNAINTYNGTWTVTTTGSSVYLALNVGAAPNSGLLNRTWQVTDIYASSINFQDFSGGTSNAILVTMSK